MTNAEAILKKYFGYDEFRTGQQDIISALLNGQDVLGVMPTGAGKSICYQIPAIMFPGVSIVISPLISLMMDQVKSLNEAGIRAAYINSSLTNAQITKALGFAAQGLYKIVYVAPERLESDEFRNFAKSIQISMVTVDEAHCISQWGDDFRPSYLKIVEFVNSLKKRPVIGAFTATATCEVRNDIVKVLGLTTPFSLVTGFDRENLYFGVETPRNKNSYIVNYLQEHVKDSGIIYCATRKNVDKVYDLLTQQGFSVTRYHAGLTNEERCDNQEDFIYDRKLIIVATNAFGMGIDKSNVRYVLHYNMPQSIEHYYQEAGRAGRDGEKAECILLFSGQDLIINNYLLDAKQYREDITQYDMKVIRDRDSKRLRSIVDYCRTTECLRGYILRYFGEETLNTCDNCSSCLMEFEEIDRTEAARSIFNCIHEAKGRYGVNVIASTLMGSNRAKLRDYGCMNYTTFGALKDLSEIEIKDIITSLIFDGYIEQTEDKYGLLRLTQAAFDQLSGDERIILKYNKNKSKDVDKKAPAAKTKHSDLQSEDQELFEQLRQLRMVIAKEESVPPYIVFSDKTLVDMCMKKPSDKPEMLNVTGVGENKFEKYGQRFIDEIQKCK